MEAAAELEYLILGQIEREASIRSKLISVDVHEDTVCLRGHVLSWSAFEAVERLARETPGIRHVDNRLSVVMSDRGEPSGRGMLEEKLHKLLQGLPELDEAPIRIRTDDGKVTLSGYVETPYQRILAEGLALGLEGVEAVRNHILVVDVGDVNDRILARRLSEHLMEAMSEVDLPRIHVSGGEVSVTGVVEDQGAAARIIDALHEVDGVWRVRDRLQSA